MNGRRKFLTSLVALATGAALAGPAVAQSWPYATAARGGVASMEIVDRGNRSELYVYEKDGQRYVIGTPGNEYTIRIRNLTGARILAVTSVDGVNVITGDTAAPGQSGYVLGPWESVDIAGWRKNMQNTAAFFFTDHANSYAARTGRPNDVGVIGVAVFREREYRTYYPPRDRIASSGSAGAAKRAQAPASAGEPMNEPAPAAPSTREESMAQAQPQRDAEMGAMNSFDAREPQDKVASKLGTGHGRIENNAATQVRFERATSYPAETIVVRYDRRENLAAMGVLPTQWPRYADRSPNAFPGAMRFVPDPR